MSTAYADPRPIADALQPPEVDTASLNDVLDDCGWELQAVNWVFEQVTGQSLVATIITPITGDWSKIRADGDAWRMVGTSMNDMSYNLTDNVAKVREHWDGDAAKSHEMYIALGWKAGLLAEMGVAHLIAKGFDLVAEGAEALGKQAARLLDYLVKKLVQAAATVWVPVAGWIKAAEMVWNAYQIYKRVMEIIETIKKLITDVKALFDSVGKVVSALGKLKDADSLAEAMNATQEVAEGAASVRSNISDIKDGLGSIKDNAKEIGERGRDVGSTVRDFQKPAGGDGTTTSGAGTPPPAGPATADTPTVNRDATTTSSAAAPPAGPSTSDTPTVNRDTTSTSSAPSSSSQPGGPTTSDAPTVNRDTTSTSSASPSSSQPGGPTTSAPPSVGGDTTTTSSSSSGDTTTSRSGDGGGTTTPPPPVSGGDSGGRKDDSKPQFGNEAMRESGPNYKDQLREIVPDENERKQYEENSRKPSHELSEEQARKVVEVRDQMTAEQGTIMTKALRDEDVQAYMEKDYAPDNVVGFVARGQDVAPINTPAGLHDGLALDDSETRARGEKGWSPIPDRDQDSAVQLRWAAQPGEQNMPIAYGAQNGQDDAAEMMRRASGQEPVRGWDPYTGSGSTGGGVPEFRANGSNMGERGEMWRMHADGSEEMFAYYTRDNGEWKPVGQ